MEQDAGGLGSANKPLAQSSKAGGYFSAKTRPIGPWAISAPNPSACKVAQQER